MWWPPSRSTAKRNGRSTSWPTESFPFGLFDLIDPIVSAFLLALYGLVFGAVVGAIMGVIAQALSSGQRDFSSVSGMQADRYNVVADAEVAAEAERLLSSMPQARIGQASGTS